MVSFTQAHSKDHNCMCVCPVAQPCPSLGDSMCYSLPGSSVHGIFQARTLEQEAISYSRGSSQGSNPRLVFSALAGGFFTTCHLGNPKLFYLPFIFISWRLITLQYCRGFCHTLTWISHRFTCVPHPDPPSHLPPHPIPLGLHSAPGRALVSCIQPGLVICFTLYNILVSMLFSLNIPPLPSPRESKRLFYKSVSFFFFLFCI